MNDTTQNYQDFLEELNKLAELFCDPMSETRQEMYWESFGAEIALEEWQAACASARDRETFHKVPVPAVLWQYVKTYRIAQEEKQRHAASLALHAPDVLEARRLKDRQEALAQIVRDEALIADAASARAPEGYKARAGNLGPVLVGLTREPGEEG